MKKKIQKTFLVYEMKASENVGINRLSYKKVR